MLKVHHARQPLKSIPTMWCIYLDFNCYQNFTQAIYPKITQTQGFFFQLHFELSDSDKELIATQLDT